MVTQWLEGSEIRVKCDNGTVIISANKAGLLSLSGQFAALAESEPGSHTHYDKYNSLEEGSSEMIVEKVL